MAILDLQFKAIYINQSNNKIKVKGVINMRVSSVDSLLTNNNTTIDEQIKCYNGKNSSQENCSDDEKAAKNFAAFGLFIVA